MLTITHTHESGTTLDGTARYDGSADVLKTRPGGAYWKWSRNLGAWFILRSRDHLPNRHAIMKTAEALRAAGFEVTVEVSDEARPTAEVVADQRERAADRADALDAKAERKGNEAAGYRERSKQISDHIPMGQPILLGHHSQRRHERDLERMHAYDEKGWRAQDEANDAARRADIARHAASGRESRTTVANRVKKHAADVARDLRTLHGHFGTWGKSHDVAWSARAGGYVYVYRAIDPDSDGGRAIIARITENTDQRRYWADVLAAMTPDDAPAAPTVVKGDWVRYRQQWYPVVRVNRKSVTLGGWLGVADKKWRAEWSEITGHKKAADVAAEAKAVGDAAAAAVDLDAPGGV